MLISLKLIDQLFLALPLHSGAAASTVPCWDRWNTLLLSEILTRQGFEVESQFRRGEGFEDVVVGRIVAAERHPKADKLQVCQVQLSQNDVRQIVCGAANARTGLYVAVALPGAKLPGGLEIKVSKIRDVESSGMLCSRAELGLPEEEDRDGVGIWELQNESSCGLPEAELQTVVGQPVFYALGLDDVIFELNVTPNRPDLLGHEGAARELYAGLKWAGEPVADGLKPWCAAWQSELSAKHILLEAQERAQLETRAGVFLAKNEIGLPTFFLGLDDVKVTASPRWLRNYLEALGQKSINSIVDAGNLILLCFAQPNHAFDLEKIKISSRGERCLTLRFADESENFLGLDGKERLLVQSDCVVADAQDVQALLGVLGGEKSKVCTDSRSLVLEFANPHPVLVRRTSRRHGRKTESSFAFEKGIDVFRRADAAQKLVGLISALQPAGCSKVSYVGSTGARVVGNLSSHALSFFSAGADALRQIDAFQVHADEDFIIRFDDHDLERRIGSELVPLEQQLSILRSLGFHVEQETKSCGARIRVPSWRRLDVFGPADLVEEIVRIVGIDRVPALPMNSVGRVQPDDQHLHLLEVSANRMVSLGYHETAGFHFMRSDDWKKLNQTSIHACGEPIALLNPIIKDEPLMQTTLVSGLLRKVAFNLNYGNKRGQLFEIARTFQNTDAHGCRVFSENGTAVALSEQLRLSVSNDDLWEYASSESLTLSYEREANERPGETPRLSGVVFGSEENKEWLNDGERLWSFHRVAAHVTELLSVFGLKSEFVVLPEKHPLRGSLHPGRSAHVVTYLDDKIVPLGWLGQFHPAVLRNFEIAEVCYGFEVNLATALKVCFNKSKFSEKNERPRANSAATQVRLPLVERDFAFLVNDSLQAASLIESVKIAADKILADQKVPARLLDINIFDVYRGHGTRLGEKSIALRVTLLPFVRALVEAEIAAVSEAIISRAQNDCGARLRG